MGEQSRDEGKGDGLWLHRAKNCRESRGDDRPLRMKRGRSWRGEKRPGTGEVDSRELGKPWGGC